MPLIRNCPTCSRSNRIPAKHFSDVGKCGACKAEIPPIGEPIEVNEEQFNEIIRESKVPVLTDFRLPRDDIFGHIVPLGHAGGTDAGRSFI
jgi:thioredoxin 2